MIETHILEELREYLGNNKALVLINGAPGSGKDTLADKILEAINTPDETRAAKLKMSAPIGRGIRQALSLSPEEYRSLREDNKDVPMREVFDKFDTGKTFRELMISFSEDFMKPMMGTTVFAELLVNKIDDYSRSFSNVSLFPVSDCGFSSEFNRAVTLFKSKFPSGVVILVTCHREGHTFENDSRHLVSVPEGWDVPHIRWRNKGNMSDCEEMADLVLSEVLEEFRAQFHTVAPVPRPAVMAEINEITEAGYQQLLEQNLALTEMVEEMEKTTSELKSKLHSARFGSRPSYNKLKNSKRKKR